MGKIFISYRRDDTAAAAERLYDDLTNYFGHRHVFMDSKTLPPGAAFPQEIRNTIASAKVMIHLMGKQWLTGLDVGGVRRIDDPNDYVRQEILTAFEKKVLVIPVLMDGATMFCKEELPAAIDRLAQLQAFGITTVRWHYDVARLIRKLEQSMGVQWKKHTSRGAGAAGTVATGIWLNTHVLAAISVKATGAALGVALGGAWFAAAGAAVGTGYLVCKGCKHVLKAL